MMLTALAILMLMPLYVAGILMRRRIIQFALRHSRAPMFRLVIRRGKARGLTRIKESSHG